MWEKTCGRKRIQNGRNEAFDRHVGGSVAMIRVCSHSGCSVLKLVVMVCGPLNDLQKNEQATTMSTWTKIYKCS